MKELETRAFLALSAALLGLRLYAARAVGFGDSEALYASYALHPQPAYLDHPGSIGFVAWLIGHGAAPTPFAAHQITALVATVVPFLAVLAARAAGATWARAFVAGIALACVPEIAVGLFAMTPDLLLAVTWLGVLALAAFGLRAEPDTGTSAFALVGAGLLAGIGCTAKATGVLLLVALVLAYGAPHARRHARTLWPWAGVLAGLLVTAPVVLYEARSGWPMLRHRLVDTQAGAGPSARNVFALVSGQIAYISPLLAILAVKLGRDVWRARATDAVSGLLFFALIIPLAVLVPLAVVSRVAEPHWIAPPLLALPIFWASRDVPVATRRFGVAACATGLALSLAAHAWVLVPSLARVLPSSFDARWDIASELYGWSDVVRAVQRAPLPTQAEEDVFVVGPHWVICAQLEAALGTKMHVGCATPIADDFDGWAPRVLWKRAAAVIYVQDTRFEVDPEQAFPGRAVTFKEHIVIPRGGRIARDFTITVLSLRGLAKTDVTPPEPPAASREAPRHEGARDPLLRPGWAW